MYISQEASHIPTSVLTERGERVKKFGVRTGAVALTALVGITYVSGAQYTPEYGPPKVSSPAEPGDGIDNLLVRDVEGIGSVDRRDVRDNVKKDPANIATLVDGLQIGETLIVPSTVSR